MNQKDVITINGIEYIPKDSVINSEKAEKLDGLKYVIVRTYSAGVFAGYLKKKDGKEVILLKARRIWYWDGAASLSQLAVDGVSKPENCKFPCEVDYIELTEAIEIIDCTKKAQNSIKGVKVWQQ
jgi:hypothetical protein